MKRKDFVFTLEFLNRYGVRVVNAIKDRIKQDGLIDTGALQASINYKITYYAEKFNIVFAIGNGVFKKGSGLPSEYGVYLDQGTIYIDPYYFFTAPIPGLGEAYFNKSLQQAMERDISVWLNKEAKRILLEK